MRNRLGRRQVLEPDFERRDGQLTSLDLMAILVWDCEKSTKEWPDGRKKKRMFRPSAGY